MKTVLFLLMLSLSHISLSQELSPNSFDFWIGDWDLTWVNAQGIEMKGTNRIIKILDGKVIQENFTNLQNGYKGMSLSVFNPRTKIWHQAWTDSNGGYFNFSGAHEDGYKTFKTDTQKLGDKKIIKRMQFKNITNNSLMWDWEVSEDGGNSWRLAWRINYKRVNK